MNIFLSECAAAVGAAHVLTTELASYLTDWRGRGGNAADAVIRPANTAQVATVLALCSQHHIAVVAQGGNTGLVMGSAPRPEHTSSHTSLHTSSHALSHINGAIILSLTRMNHISSIDVINNSMVVEAGVVLQKIHDTLEPLNRVFPLSLAAQASCTIGGNLATNAGGVHVVRYGMARQLCLGIEAITAQGEVLNSLSAVHKNNSGYDWRDLLIGSEGTLAVITRATLKIFPAPRASASAWIFCGSMRDAVTLFTAAQNELGNFVCAFEVMMMACVKLVRHYFPNSSHELSTDEAPMAILLDLEHNDDPNYLQQVLLEFLARHAEAGIISNALLAQSDSQRRSYWQVRELIPQAEARAFKAVKHDIALPISALTDFVAHAEQLLSQSFPGCTPYYFGHCGDGNLHYNVMLAPAYATDFDHSELAINRLIYDLVSQYGGSFSAEHGIGRLRVNHLKHYRSATEINLFHTLKKAFDPQNILNPDVIVPL